MYMLLTQGRTVDRSGGGDDEYLWRLRHLLHAGIHGLPDGAGGQGRRVVRYTSTLASPPTLLSRVLILPRCESVTERFPVQTPEYSTRQLDETPLRHKVIP